MQYNAFCYVFLWYVSNALAAVPIDRQNPSPKTQQRVGAPSALATEIAQRIAEDASLVFQTAPGDSKTNAQPLMRNAVAKTSGVADMNRSHWQMVVDASGAITYVADVNESEDGAGVGEDRWYPPPKLPNVVTPQPPAVAVNPPRTPPQAIGQHRQNPSIVGENGGRPFVTWTRSPTHSPTRPMLQPDETPGAIIHDFCPMIDWKKGSIKCEDTSTVDNLIIKNGKHRKVILDGQSCKLKCHASWQRASPFEVHCDNGAWVDQNGNKVKAFKCKSRGWVIVLVVGLTVVFGASALYAYKRAQRSVSTSHAGMDDQNASGGNQDTRPSAGGDHASRPNNPT